MVIETMTLSGPADILTGESLQQLCSVYCGTKHDLHYNPQIARETNKHLDLDMLNSPWENPSLLFCYNTQSIYLFQSKLGFLTRPFVLVSHNGDENVSRETDVSTLVRHPLLLHWFSQNNSIQHPKISILPIGLANSMWSHGNRTTFFRVYRQPIHKPNACYFYFDVSTHPDRIICKKIVQKKGLHFGIKQSFDDYVRHLASHRFAIVPTGNGNDTHRMWECYYLRVIPIVLRSPFTERIREQLNLPMIMLNTWDELVMEQYELQYPTLFQQLNDHSLCLRMEYWKQKLIKSMDE